VVTAQARTLPRVHVIAPARLGETAIAALRAREIDARLADAPGSEIVAWALDVPPVGAAAIELAQACARAAATGRPVCLLAPTPRGSGRPVFERTAALAYLRAYGAALAHDVDAWLEAVVALAHFGMPRGRRAAVIAPPGSWLEAQAHAIAAEGAELGARPFIVHDGRGEHHDPTDVVLYDAGLGASGASVGGLHVPVQARSELADDRTSLRGLRPALGAVDILGYAAERIAIGLGPAPLTASAELGIDSARLQRQLGKLPASMRVGDHETKVLLAAYGVPITRQRVALTPSAAVKAARDAGYPVELKPWGHDMPTERAGCPVEREVTSDALVRRAFAAVLAAAGKLPTRADTGAVIVREAPSPGRELVVRLAPLPALGWTVVLDGPSGPIAAAPAPLRVHDADGLAAAFGSTRAGDGEPDRVGLANLLRRASHLVADLGDRLRGLELARVIVGGRGARTVVVDAWCELA
jgi:hypothetical protein